MPKPKIHHALAAALGHRCHLAERVQFEVERVEG
jgi:hypothetical protein